jgi:outer membrane receptor protein involved in Fe transport
LEEVIVTAQKRTERLQDVPNAVTAISVDRLQNEAANGLQDYFREIPGLSVQGSQGAEQISIRGITSSGFTGPTVGIYIDDTPIGTSVAGDHASSLAPDLDPGDLQQVEVLRGPQGTLYGAAAIGGLLKYVTVLPNLQDYSGRIEADGSSVDHGGYGYTLRGAFNGPIVTDVLAITASGYFRQDPGYISNIGAIDNPQTNQVLPSQGRTDINEDHDYGGRVAVLWKPEDDLAVKVSALFQHRQNDGGGYESINGLTQQPTSGDLNQISSAYTGASTVKLQVYNAALNWDLHWASLLSSTSYSQNSEQSVTDITGQLPPSPTSGFPPPGYPPFVFPNAGITYFNPALSGPYYTPVGLAYQTDKVTEELRLTSPSSQRLEWQAGLFYTNEETRGEQDISLDNPATGAAYPVTGICAPPAAYAQPYGPPPCAVMSYTAPAGAVFDHSLDRSTYVEYAGYTNSTYHFTDDFSLAAGIRYSENRQTSNPYAVGVLNVVSGSPYASSVENTKGSGNDLTYLVSPTLRISDDAMVYGRVATGYRPGGVNQLLPGSVIPTSFAPDKTTNYELGSKTTLFDGRMSINAAAFLINWSGVQLTAINPQDEFYFANGRTARSKGVELEVVVRPLDGLTIRANGAYDSSSLTADIPLSEGVAGFKGDALPFAPNWTGALSADEAVRLGNGWTGHFGADYQYVGGEYVDFNSYPTPGNTSVLPPSRTHLDSYGLINLRAGVSYDAWDVRLFVRNVADKRAFISESVIHATYGLTEPGGQFIADAGTPIMPRLIGITIVRSF